MAKNFIKFDNRLSYAPAIRWRLFNIIEGYFLFSPLNRLECFLKIRPTAPPKYGSAFSIGIFGAGIRIKPRTMGGIAWT